MGSLALSEHWDSGRAGAVFRAGEFARVSSENHGMQETATMGLSYVRAAPEALTEDLNSPFHRLVTPLKSTRTANSHVGQLSSTWLWCAPWPLECLLQDGQKNGGGGLPAMRPHLRKFLGQTALPFPSLQMQDLPDWVIPRSERLHWHEGLGGSVWHLAVPPGPLSCNLN